jgi:hypothetical protein
MRSRLRIDVESSNLLWVVNATICDDVGSLSLWHICTIMSAQVKPKERLFGRTRGVLNLCNSLFTPAFPQKNACRRSMSKDVAADRLPPICASEERTGSRIALNLIGHEHGDVEL